MEVCKKNIIGPSKIYSSSFPYVLVEYFVILPVAS